MTLITAFLMFFAVQDDDSRPKELREMESLRQDVETIRLLNDLKLSKEQKEKLVAAAEEAQKKIAEASKDAAEAIETVTKSLKEQKDAALKGEPIADEKLQSFHESQRKVQEIYRAIEEAGREASKKLKEILDADQQEELGWNTRHDPVSHMRRWAREVMKRSRDIPDEQFVEGVGNQVLDFFEHFNMIPEEAREAEADRVFKIITEAHDLKAEDFAKQQGALLKKIVTEGKIGELAKKMRGPGGPGGGGPGMGPGGPDQDPMGRWLTQPRVLRLLKEKK